MKYNIKYEFSKKKKEILCNACNTKYNMNSPDIGCDTRRVWILIFNTRNKKNSNIDNEVLYYSKRN